MRVIERVAAGLWRRGKRAPLRRAGALAAMAAILAPVPAAAVLPQSWNGYKWARKGPLKIRVGDNVAPAWDPYLDSAIRGWNPATNIDLQRAGGSTNPASCAPVYGSIQACSASYGATGWLGYANVWLSGGFITRATVRLNDYYFTQPRYNTDGWRSLVLCQELGHTLGLAHNNSISSDANKGSCMDYTNDPTGTLGTNGTLANTRPSASDFTNLNRIYATTGRTQLFTTTVGYRAGDGYSIDGEHIEFAISSVPEPASWALLVTGLGAIGAALRRRRSSNPGQGPAPVTA